MCLKIWVLTNVLYIISNKMNFSYGMAIGLVVWPANIIITYYSVSINILISNNWLTNEFWNTVFGTCFSSLVLIAEDLIYVCYVLKNASSIKKKILCRGAKMSMPLSCDNRNPVSGLRGVTLCADQTTQSCVGYG